MKKKPNRSAQKYNYYDSVCSKFIYLNTREKEQYVT